MNHRLIHGLLMAQVISSWFILVLINEAPSMNINESWTGKVTEGLASVLSMRNLPGGTKETHGKVQ
jgi:hypothetical protein